MRSTFRPLISVAALLAAAVVILSSCGKSSSTANVRLLNVSTGYSSLDLYASNNGDTNPSYTAQLQGVAYQTLSNYASIGSGTYSLEFRNSGSSSALATDGSENLTDGSHNTYVGYGSSGNFATVKIGEDQSSANSGYAKVTVINASEAGSVDVYLTDSTTDLVNASPLVSNIATGASSTITVTSGNYRLRVIGTGDTTDLRADVAQVTFSSTTVNSLLLTSTTGGMLVNVSLLPQQGSLSTYNNTQARVRGAVGIANGTTVNATVSGANILTNATVGVIGGIYTLVDSGSLPVTLNVDGASVAVPNQTLAAGADYTFLVWSNASGTQTSLITDVNTLPASLATKSRVRLLNGMSGLADPLTLLVNFQTGATGVTLGTASALAQFTSGTDNEVDVIDTNTSATLLTKTTLTLDAGGVYTMFMAGGGNSPVNGTLRKDR
jgi:Flp pilus assembly protein protease CpaA